MDAKSTEEFTGGLLKYRQALLAYIRTITRDHHLAEDVFQEMAIAMAKEWDAGNQARNFWAFAKEIARRRALAAVRNASRLQLLDEDSLDRLDRAFDEIVDSADSRARALRVCIRKLPLAWREVLELRYWQNFRVKEIARRAGRSESAISVTLNRARARLLSCVRYVASE